MRKVTIFLSNETKGIIFSSETTPAIQKRFMIGKLFKVKLIRYVKFIFYVPNFFRLSKKTNLVNLIF